MHLKEGFVRHFVISVFLTATLAIAGAVSVDAKVPEEVMKPYKAYAAALKAGDEKAAYKNAKMAWKTAEKVLGDSKTTGDLAQNFADLRTQGSNPYKVYQERLAARKRAIELAKFYPADQVGLIETERTLNLVETSLKLKVKRGEKLTAGGNGAYFDDADRALEKHDLKGSTFEGDLEAMRAQFYNARGLYKKSVEHADRAIAIYDARTDDVASAYIYAVHLYKGNSLREIEQPIKAALQYQTVMQNLEGAIPSDHLFVKTAFVSWMNTRSELEDAGRLDEAEQAGLCECWPFEDYKNKVTPLKRIPPTMPSAFTRGRHSGHVQVTFDVDDEGKPYNIRTVSSTDSRLDKSAIASVKKWVFTSKTDDEPKDARQNVSNKITYRLMNSNGKILLEPRQ